MTDRICRLCREQFRPTNNMNWYCRKNGCAFKNTKMKSNHRQRYYDHSKRAQDAEKRAILRIKGAMETRAEYISKHYLRTGVLLQF